MYLHAPLTRDIRQRHATAKRTEDLGWKRFATGDDGMAFGDDEGVCVHELRRLGRVGMGAFEYALSPELTMKEPSNPPQSGT